MAKMWAGRTDGITDSVADDFNSSIRIDARMFREDIAGSIAHAAMLKKQGILAPAAADHITEGLRGILQDLENGDLKIDPQAEDIHMFVEQILTERIGAEGKMLHTARSRNDQVALDTRMYLRGLTADLKKKIVSLIEVLNDATEKYGDTVMPGYTHLQRAQPVVFGQHLLAYEMMFLRDVSRLEDAAKRMNMSPIGACALAGTTYDTDREYEAELLGFDGLALNSMDAVSDRDFCLEMLSALSILMMHMSRFAEEIILWSSWEFRFIELSDAYTTGSSIMPQKKNPDMAELIRGKTGRVYGDLMSLLTVMKGIPLAYNKDM
ncbi:MAG: argininosuccinate lyase, partial [Solobacterium sp.]|nr:argininosuccinate lyase [Solobacterium sp.]